MPPSIPSRFCQTRSSIKWWRCSSITRFCDSLRNCMSIIRYCNRGRAKSGLKVLKGIIAWRAKLLDRTIRPHSQSFTTGVATKSQSWALPRRPRQTSTIIWYQVNSCRTLQLTWKDRTRNWMHHLLSMKKKMRMRAASVRLDKLR